MPYPKFTFTNTHTKPQIQKATKMLQETIDITEAFTNDITDLSINNCGSLDRYVEQCSLLILEMRDSILYLCCKMGIKTNSILTNDDFSEAEYDLTFLAKS